MARDFDGSNDYCEALNPNFGAQPYAVSAWVRTDTSSHGSGRAIVSYGDFGTPTGFLVRTNSSRAIQVRHSNASFIAGTTALTVDQWHHVLFNWEDLFSNKLFLDGSVEADTGFSGPAAQASTDDFYIGEHTPNDTAGTGFWSGLIAEVYYWSGITSEFTDQEVLDVMNGYGHLVRSADLKAYWPLWGNRDPEPDYSGGGNGMDLVSAPPKGRHAPIPMPNFFKNNFVDVEAAAGGASIPCIMRHRKMLGIS
jgi:hypothetical protein